MALLPIYSTRFLAFAADGTPAPYTVPTGFVAVVRDADIWSGGGAMINFQLSINAVAKFWAGQFTVESIAQVAQWRGRVVVNEGEDLVFAADGVVDGVVGGYLLTAP